MSLFTLYRKSKQFLVVVILFYKTKTFQNSFYFLYFLHFQVSLPHYEDSEFNVDSVRRYRMYLHLKKKNPKTFLVPCYDMDLIWHTHQVHPQDYHHDMNHILGFVLKHDDSVNDRAPGSKLNQSDEVTRKLWMSKFQVSRRRF